MISCFTVIISSHSQADTGPGDMYADRSRAKMVLQDRAKFEDMHPHHIYSGLILAQQATGNADPNTTAAVGKSMAPNAQNSFTLRVSKKRCEELIGVLAVEAVLYAIRL